MSRCPMHRAEIQDGLVLRLALRDYWHDWVLSLCFVLAIAAMLMPLLVLFGLKFGIITNLLAPLKEDPRWQRMLEHEGLADDDIPVLESAAERYKAEYGFTDPF